MSVEYVQCYITLEHIVQGNMKTKAIDSSHLWKPLLGWPRDFTISPRSSSAPAP
jgi:hypothetical protein